MPAPEMNVRDGTGRAIAEDARTPVRQQSLQPAFANPPIDRIEHMREPAREQARDQPPSGCKAPVGGDQMISPARRHAG